MQRCLLLRLSDNDRLDAAVQNPKALLLTPDKPALDDLRVACRYTLGENGQKVHIMQDARVRLPRYSLMFDAEV